MGRSANALLLLFLLCFVAMVATSEHLVDEELEASLASAKSVLVHVSSGVQRHNTRNPACSSARNAVIHANVYLQGPMPTRKNAHATITGRPREEAQNALRAFFCYSFPISS
ncbi:uncharacterized protein LOC109830668 isoform X1 [Asparagus officinalis]|uniref:uncharacterized protein LOC109830668 isoform X1 n=1 Tax=Asparagus officinalis TaxID=4686 RepID=UPI00098E6FF2|nr:uncharacterized protein LOC109830668 isoform X1 [Asparagus officinalis]